MLAEIFFLRLEAALRAEKESTQAGNVRFMSRAPSIVPNTLEGPKDLVTSPDNYFYKAIKKRREPGAA